jgi:hypothetical protein
LVTLNPLQSARRLGDDLAPISEIKTHVFFHHDIILNIPSSQDVCMICATAVAVEALSSVIAKLEAAGTAQVGIFLGHYAFDVVDLKPMIGPVGKKRWLQFIDDTLPASLGWLDWYESADRRYIHMMKGDFKHELGLAKGEGQRDTVDRSSQLPNYSPYLPPLLSYDNIPPSYFGKMRVRSKRGGLAEVIF